MYNPLSVFLGLRYVRSRQGNGFSAFISASSTLGIALGVMVLIVVLSAMNGFERELSQRLLSIIPHAELIAVNGNINNSSERLKQVVQHKNVLVAAPVIKMSGMIQKGIQLKGLEIKGVDIALESQVSSIAELMIQGTWQDLAKAPDNGIIIGAGIAKKLNLKVGDSAQLLLPQPSNHALDAANSEQQDLSKQFAAPVKHKVNVVGIFKFGGTIDDTLAYIALPLAQQLMNYQADEIQGIRMKLDKVFDAYSIAREVAQDFTVYVYIYDWTRTQGHIYNDIKLVRMVMFIVLVLVIAVASFNIVSTLIMAVNDKKGDIAILKTMGADPATIMFTFIIQGLANGFLGSLLGALTGVGFALNLTQIIVRVESFFSIHFLSADIYFIDYIPSELHTSDVVITVITALVLSLIATVYPSWRATQVEPAQVLGQL